MDREATAFGLCSLLPAPRSLLFPKNTQKRNDLIPWNNPTAQGNGPGKMPFPGPQVSGLPPIVSAGAARELSSGRKKSLCPICTMQNRNVEFCALTFGIDNARFQCKGNLSACTSWRVRTRAAAAATLYHAREQESSALIHPGARRNRPQDPTGRIAV